MKVLDHAQFGNAARAPEEIVALLDRYYAVAETVLNRHATIKFKLSADEDKVIGFIASTGDRDLLTVETTRGAEQTISTGKYEVTGRGGRGRDHGVHAGRAPVGNVVGPLGAVPVADVETLLLDGIDGVVINGDHDHRLSNNLHVSIPDVPNDAVIAKLRHTVALSTGAACSSGAQTSSHVLRAMGLSYSLQEGALRISTGKFTTDEEIELAGKYIVEAVTAVRGGIGG